jgi:peptidoglycan/LPS O-acetylase OafA/YrhL
MRRTDQTLDFLRWTSAALVAICHLRSFLFIDAEPSILQGHVDARLLATKTFYFITSLGNEAVVVFFVISGYLIGGKLLVEGVRDFPDYLCHRVSRIYIVLLPAIALTLTLDYFGAQLSMGHVLYDQGGWSGNLKLVSSQNHGLSTIACNVANLQTEFCAAVGSNGPLWSLGFEWFYYITFPLLLMAMPGWRLSPLWVLWPGTVGALIYIFPNFTFFYPIWIMGAASRMLFDRKWIPISASYAGAVALALLVLFARNKGLGLSINFMMGGALALALANNLASPKLPGALNQKMADFSFSLYVIHHPLMVFMLSAALSAGLIPERQQVAAYPMALFIGAIVLVYLVALVFSRFTERKTPVFRDFLRSVISRFYNKPALRIVE